MKQKYCQYLDKETLITKSSLNFFEAAEMSEVARQHVVRLILFAPDRLVFVLNFSTSIGKQHTLLRHLMQHENIPKILLSQRSKVT